jgi:hypothetical protein
MKKILPILTYIIIGLLMLPITVSAISIGWDRYTQGIMRTLYPGDTVLIGARATTTDSTLEVNGDITTGYITAASTTATSSLPRLTVSTSISLLGEYITNLTTWVQGAIDAHLSGGEGVTYSSGAISFDCSEVEGTGIDCSGEDITLDATGDWTGTLDGYEASALLDNTDDQTLSLVTNTLSIEDGNSVDLSSYVNDAETDPVWIAASTDYYTKTESDANYDTLGQATSTLNSHTSTYNHDNYDTAYSWGDHSLVGYLTSLTPWIEDIQAAGYNLFGFGTATGTGITVTNATTTDLYVSGYVGIASTTPSRTLTVEGDGYTGGDLTVTGTTTTTGLEMTNSPSYDGVLARINTRWLQFGPSYYPANYVTACDNCSYFVMDKDAEADDTSILFRDQGNARAEIGLVGDNKLHFKTVTGSFGSESFTDAMVLTAGRLGIATSTPQYALDVVGSIQGTNLRTKGDNGALVMTADTDGGDYNIYSSNGNQTLALYGSAGNVLNMSLLDGNLTVGGDATVSGNLSFEDSTGFAVASSSPFVTVGFASGDAISVIKDISRARNITKLRCKVVGGTSIVINVSDGTNDTETLTCGTTWTEDTDITTNDSFTAGEDWETQLGTVIGAVDYLYVEIYYDVN